jgi:polyphosphate kinase 2
MGKKAKKAKRAKKAEQTLVARAKAATPEPGVLEGDVAAGEQPKMKRKEYEQEMRLLQGELVAMQEWVKATGAKVCIVFEGLDSAGKGGTIRRITERTSPRVFKHIALPAPTDREKSQMYLQRYIAHFPAAGEVAIFDRSWYNRAGVERVMEFCTDAEYEQFMDTVPAFEQMLIRSGIRLFKYYLDISKDEQKKRLADRRSDPLKQWKMSPIDAVAQKHWDDYSVARNEMFARTHSALTPWTVVRADDKQLARLNVIKDLLARLDYADKDHDLVHPNSDIVFAYAEAYLANGMIAP